MSNHDEMTNFLAGFGIENVGKRGRNAGAAAAAANAAILTASKGGKTVNGRKAFAVTPDTFGAKSMATVRKHVKAFVAANPGTDVTFGKNGAVILLPKSAPATTGRKTTPKKK